MSSLTPAQRKQKVREAVTLLEQMQKLHANMGRTVLRLLMHPDATQEQIMATASRLREQLQDAERRRKQLVVVVNQEFSKSGDYSDGMRLLDRLKSISFLP